jgi:hypothetical protein
MKSNSALVLVLSCAVLSLAAQIIKFVQLRNLKEVYKNRIEFRWFTRYSTSEIYGTSSDEKRVFMEKSNKLTLSFWLLAAASISLFILGTQMFR